MKCFLKFVLILTTLALLLNAAERFETVVRADFFAGMAGDQTAMDRAMKTCDLALAKNPKNAEALVWHGSGTLFLAGQSFRAGDFDKALERWSQGLKEMSDAVALAPENPEVLLVRGGTLLTAAPSAPDADQGEEITRTGVGDLQKLYATQRSYFDGLSVPVQGRMLFHLASGYGRLNDKEHATAAFEALAALGAASGHEAEARQWLASGKR